MRSCLQASRGIREAATIQIALSKRRGTSVNRLIDEMTTLLLADFYADTRFQMRAERGRGKAARGVELLRKARGD